MTDPARRTVAALALGGCLLAACSSSGSGGGSGPASSGPSATSSSTSSAGSSAPSSTSAVSGDSNSTFCATARRVQESESKQTTQLASGSPADVKKFVDRAEVELAAFQSLAPQQLKADAAVVVDTAHKLYAALKADGYDFRKLASSPGLQKQIDSPAARAASQRVGTYLTQVCKIKTG